MAQWPLHFDSALQELSPGLLAHPAVQDYMRRRSSVLVTALRGTRAAKEREAQVAIAQERQLRQEEAEQRERDRIPNALAAIERRLAAIEERLAAADAPKPTRYDWGNNSTVRTGPPAVEAVDDRRVVPAGHPAGEGERRLAMEPALPAVDPRPIAPKSWRVRVAKRDAGGKVVELKILPGAE